MNWEMTWRNEGDGRVPQTLKTLNPFGNLGGFNFNPRKTRKIFRLYFFY